MRYAVIDNAQKVINVIIWDELSNWEPPYGCFLVKTDVGNIGDTYDIDSNTFSTPQGEGE